MEQIEIKASPRTITGKKVKVLRRQGKTPVHVFGKGIDSLALECDTSELRRVLAAAGASRLISLSVKGERRPRTVMVREVQFASLTGALLHVDFYQVQMEQEVRVDVPIELVGEAPALRHKENSLIQELTTLSVRARPGKVPSSLPVDISSLAEAGAAIRVEDIRVDEGITILNEPHQAIARIEVATAEVVEAAEEEAAEVAEAAEGAAAPAETPGEQSPTTPQTE